MLTNQYLVIILAFVKCTTDAYKTRISVKSDGKTINTKVAISEESSDYLDLIAGSDMWADKSNLIGVIAKSYKNIFVITAPKRFGKSINLSMLKLFFEQPTDTEGNLIPLYDTNAYKFFVERKIPPRSGTANPVQTVPVDSRPLICDDVQVTEEHLAKYPVIYLDLNGLDVNKDGFSFKERIIGVFEKFSNFLNKKWDAITEAKNGSSLDEFNKDRFNKIRKGEVQLHLMVDSMKFLCGLLHRYYHKKVVVLIDGYDSLVEEFYLNPNATLEKSLENNMINFYWSFMTYTLKENEDLHKAVLTGLFRLVWNIGLKPKDIEEYDIGLMKNLYPFYGFTSGEVDDMIKKRGLKDNVKKEAMKWFGEYTNANDTSQIVFSTHSVVKFINSKTMKKYWVDSEPAKFIFRWLKDESFANDVKRMKEFQTFPYSDQGISFEDFNRLKKAIIREKVSDREYDLILIVLHQLGYLTVIREISPTVYEGEVPATTLYFKVPNREIATALQEILKETKQKA